VSEVLEILGVLCLIALAYVVWPPLVLLPIGVTLLVAGVALDGLALRKKDE
jgi:hypothetical protein